MMLVNEYLDTAIMKAATASSFSQEQFFTSEISRLLDITVQNMYAYGCIIMNYEKEAKHIIVSIPAQSELNIDGNDPIYEKAAQSTNPNVANITLEQMRNEIEEYFHIIGPDHTLEIEVRPETWTIEDYKQYRRSKTMENTTLSTIQKTNKLNRVFRNSEVGPGGAHHDYRICKADSPDDVICEIHFQKGPRNVEGSRHGVIDEDLLEIVRDRMRSFQAGEFATPDNAKALEHIEIALMYLNKRKEDRAERNVLGTYNK